MIILVILSWWVCSYPSTMASFYRHRCWLLFFCRFYLFPHCPWVQPLVGFTYYIGSTLMSNHIIAIYHNCFSAITMASFHCHRCWLLYFEVFLWLLPTDECDHLLGSLLTLEVIFWAIILSLYIIIVFFQNNGVISLSLLFNFILFIFFNDSSPWMTATTCWDRWLHWKYFAERSYYRHISALFLSQKMVSFHWHRC